MRNINKIGWLGEDIGLRAVKNASGEIWKSKKKIII
jgi:hypothetical protein